MVASESVKVRRDVKRMIDILQAEATLATGCKVSQEALLAEVVRIAVERKEELFRRLGRVRRLKDEEADEVLEAISADWGVETSEGEIDRVLYGA
ncbi:hypothetical protein HRbin02_01969 [Candidatus Calditenuaceae archaeon HR02]|nr:hypothetical protein HRbin02_01969 [Candidatus Calditenuaceae archaeon HR02]